MILSDSILSRYKDWKDEELRKSFSWSPFLFLIGVLFFLIFKIYILSATNDHIGNPATPLTLKAELAPLDTMWFSVSPSKDGQNLVVTSSERRVFIWNPVKDDANGAQKWVLFLKEQIQQLYMRATLQRRMSASQTRLTLSVDKKVKYSELRSVLGAMAQAGISEYAFEVRHP